MAKKVASDETDALRLSVLQTETSERVEREIRPTRQVLKQRTKELATALAIMRATLEATTDGILVTDENGKVTDFNDKFLAMWKIPREPLKGSKLVDVQELSSRNFAEPERFFSRITEINTTSEESFDVLELADGRIFERSSKVLFVEGLRVGRVWSFHDVTQRDVSEITSRRLAAIVASSDDAIIGKDLNSVITSWNRGAERIFPRTVEPRNTRSSPVFGVANASIILKPFALPRTAVNSTSP